MDLFSGKALAGELIDLIRDSTLRVEVAGGIRREKPFPHDIELVAVPRYEPSFVDTLFGREPGAPINLLDSRMNELLGKRTIEPAPRETGGRRAPFSEKLYRFRFQHETIDLFAVTPPAEFGPIFACRTGDAGFTQHLVSHAHPRGIRFIDGRIFQHIDAQGKPVPVGLKHDHEGCQLVHLPAPEETDVFRVIGLPYLEPKKRESRKQPAETQ
jgi:DNA polymerase/3'-5' exonuclease PolX